MKIRHSFSDNLFQFCSITVFCIIFIGAVYPFYYIFIVSFSNPQAVQRGAVRFLPSEITLNNYKQVFALPGIFSSFFVSAARTVTGTICTLFFTSILAYTVTKPQLPARKFFYRFSVIAMYINAGLIPWYLTLRSLGLKDNFLVYILPYAVSSYSLILIKTYIEQVSAPLEESAMIDGAGYFLTYYRIVLPVCTPVLAAVAVFTAVSQWNQWIDNLLLVNINHLKTLQMTLLEFLNQADFIAREARSSGGLTAGSSAAITPFSIRMTVTMVVTIPILLIYPFMQRYFIKGIMIGAIKG